MDTVRDSVRNNDRFDDPLMRIYFRTIRMNFDSIEGGRGTIFLVNFSILKYNSLIDQLISKNDTSNKRSERINYTYKIKIIHTETRNREEWRKKLDGL